MWDNVRTVFLMSVVLFKNGNFINLLFPLPMPVAARSKDYECGCWLAGVAGSNPVRGPDDCL